MPDENPMLNSTAKFDTDAKDDDATPRINLRECLAFAEQHAAQKTFSQIQGGVDVALLGGQKGPHKCPGT